MREPKEKESKLPIRPKWFIWGGIAAIAIGFFVAPWWGSSIATVSAFSSLGDWPYLWSILVMICVSALSAFSGKYLLTLLGGLLGIIATVIVIYLMWNTPNFGADMQWGIPLTLLGFASVALGGFQSLKRYAL